MFDLSLPKIMVVLTIALFVLGPERLPAMVRQAGRWLGELRRLRESVESQVKGVLGELPGPGSNGSNGAVPNPLTGMDNPFAGLHDSVSSIGESLRSVLGTSASGAAAGAATGGAPDRSDGSAAVAAGPTRGGPAKRPLPPRGHSNRNPDGSPLAPRPPAGAGAAAGGGGSSDGAGGSAEPQGSRRVGEGGNPSSSFHADPSLN